MKKDDLLKNEEQKFDYDISLLLEEFTVLNVVSQEETDKFLDFCQTQGLDVHKLCYEVYAEIGSKLCFCLYDQSYVSYSDLYFYKKKDYKILKMKDIITVQIEEQKSNEQDDKYYVSVEGGKAPKHAHSSLDDAEKEAIRLSSMIENINQKVRVLKEVKTFVSKIETKEVK